MEVQVGSNAPYVTVVGGGGTACGSVGRCSVDGSVETADVRPVR